MELEAKAKRIQKSSATLGCDRLSSLPDCMLLEIMSRLKARQAVQTCVLATRWRHLWRSVPCLDIDQSEFETAGPNRNEEEEWDKFEAFTDHLLIPNNISIALLDTFRMHIEPGNRHCSGRQAAKWIRYAIKYNTQVSGIQHKGLSSSPWRLKRLQLSNLSLEDSFMKHVNSACQYLEDLELKGCYFTFHDIAPHSMKNLILDGCKGRLSEITSLTLQTLVIRYNRFRDTRDVPLVIMAPAVAYLDLAVAYVSLNEMPSLSKALINLYHIFHNKQFKILDSVSNVTHLCLSYFEPMMKNEEFPKFQNLRTLILQRCDLSDNFQMLVHFLQNSPNLEKLTLQYCTFPKYTKKKKVDAKLKRVVDVQCRNLKVTEITYEDDDDADDQKIIIRLTKVDARRR